MMERLGASVGRGTRTVVGRGAELARLRALIDPDTRVGPAVVVVSGEAGVGKTSLVRVALESFGTRSAWVTADAAERSLDFGVLDRLVRRLGRSDLSQEGTPQDAFEGGVRLLRALDGALEPALALVVDDAHLSDVRSLEALAFVARRLETDDVAFVLVTTEDGLDSLPASLIRQANDLDGHLRLGGLGVEAIGELVRTAYGRSAPTAAVQRLQHHTSGNPLHTLTLLDSLDVATLVSVRALPSPQSFRTLMIASLADCSPDARRFAAALAVLDGPARTTDVAAVAGIAESMEPPEELRACGIITVVDGSTGRLVQPAHSLVRASIVDDLSPPERAALHRRAAIISSPERALAHRLAGAEGVDVELATEAEAAAAAAETAGLRAKAAELYLAAAGVAPARGEHQRLVLAAAEQLFVAGMPFGAWAAEIDAFDDSPRKRFILTLEVITAGRFDQAFPMLVDAHTAAVAAGEPRLAGLIAEQLSIIAVGSLSADEVLRWSSAALEAGVGTMSATVMAHGLAFLGDLPAARATMAARVDVARTTDAILDARLGHAIVALWGNDLTTASAELELVLGHRHDRGAFRAVNALAHLAETRIRQGRVIEGVDHAEHAARLVEDLAMEWLAVLPRSIAAFGLAIVGDLDRARAHAAAARRIADAVGQVPARIWSSQADLRIAVAEQDHHTVVALGDSMLAAGWQRIPEGVHHWTAAYAEALVTLGRLDAASVALDRVEADGRANDDVSVLTDAARARAAWADATGGHAHALRALAEALAFDPLMARPFERARLELAAGARHRRLGRRTEAAVLLDAAFRRFASIGAQIWSDRCTRELVACGLRPRRRTAAATDLLTAQEREIARSVIAGHTNRETAAELTISAKTVEHHLSRIYAKLGVRGRMQLAAALADQI